MIIPKICARIMYNILLIASECQFSGTLSSSIALGKLPVWLIKYACKAFVNTLVKLSEHVPYDKVPFDANKIASTFAFFGAAGKICETLNNASTQAKNGLVKCH